MEPVIEFEGVRVFHGDCRDVLATLPDNSVDSVITDPPYELGFMGKKWDSSGIAYDLTVWRECLRVLKPGGHILAFGGSRTWHRLAVAIEDAGFEVRDSIAWMYGSGFPKSLDVSKAIDRKRTEDREPRVRVTSWLAGECERLGWSRAKLCDAFGVVNQPIQSWTERNANYAVIPTWDNWQRLKSLVGFDDSMDAEVWRLNGRKGKPGENWYKREVTGQHSASAAHQVWMQNYSDHLALPPKERRDEAATPEAKKWQGWGTALKPAFEPVVVGRKPLGGRTVAENVLAWGVGGLNIDGSRIGTETRVNNATGSRDGSVTSGFGENRAGFRMADGNGDSVVQGRWPANVMLDEYTAGLLDEQSGTLKSGAVKPQNKPMKKNVYEGGYRVNSVNEFSASEGGASRFFYVAKASKRDRNEGLEELEETSAADMVEREPDSAGMNSPRAGAGRTSGAKNFHPTVKPTQLMRYLIKLVTPPGGTVLDPFTGSGSTGKAALLDGFEFVGVELTGEYLPIIEGRLKWALENREDGTLF